HFAAGRERTGVSRTSGNRSDPGYRHVGVVDDCDGRGRIEGEHVVAQGAASAPAFDAARVVQRTRVVPAHCDRGDAAAQPRHRNRRIRTLMRAVAKLAVEIVPPAFDPTRVRERATLINTRGDLCNPATQTN